MRAVNTPGRGDICSNPFPGDSGPYGDAHPRLCPAQRGGDTVRPPAVTAAGLPPSHPTQKATLGLQHLPGRKQHCPKCSTARPLRAGPAHHLPTVPSAPVLTEGEDRGQWAPPVWERTLRTELLCPSIYRVSLQSGPLCLRDARIPKTVRKTVPWNNIGTVREPGLEGDFPTFHDLGSSLHILYVFNLPSWLKSKIL